MKEEMTKDRYVGDFPIRGLSLTRPWEFAFLRGGKRIENRGWRPSGRLRGCYIALCTAQSWCEEDREFIAEITGLEVPTKKESQHSQIFAVCRWNGGIALETPESNEPGLIATGMEIPEDQQRWFFGPFGWMLDDFVALKKPVPCKGALGLWGFGDKLYELIALRIAYQESLASAAAVAQ